MKKTDKQKIQKEINMLNRMRLKCGDTIDLANIMTRISKLQEKLNFLSDERFSKDGNRKFCQHMYFSTAGAGVLCGHKEANYLMCHVANFRGCDYFEEELKESKND